MSGEIPGRRNIDLVRKAQRLSRFDPIHPSTNALLDARVEETCVRAPFSFQLLKKIHSPKL